VNDAGFEDSEFPLTAGFVTCADEALYPKNTFKGKCKVEDKHAGSWGLPQQKDLRDGRAALHVDSRLPRSGRHSGRVWVPSATPITLGIPGHTTNLNGVSVANGTKYAVELWARSMPAGMTAQVTIGNWKTVDVTPTSPLGITSYTQYIGSATDPAPTVLSSNWTQISFEVDARIRPLVQPGSKKPTFNLRLSAAGVGAAGRFAAGSVWVDDVSIRNLTAIPDLP